MKKALKVIGIIVLIVFLLLLAIPFAFQSQLKDLVKKSINRNLNAEVEFSDISLSLIRNFPQAHVSIDDLVITNFEPFEEEKLATAKNIAFTMSVKELFKKAEDDPIAIKSISIDEALMTLKIDAFGNANYDITKETDTTAEASTFVFDIEDYRIDNSALTYIDEASKTSIYVTELNHRGKGTFSNTISELDTESEANVTLSIDSTNYLSNNKVKLDALIDLDLEEQKYTFKENQGFINKLPLEFKGYVKQLEDGQEIDISFSNPGSDFKDFLAVIPEEYSKNIENVETTGNFKVSGIIKGNVTETTIPTLDIDISSDNASFKYPNLPKKVSDITIHTAIKNTTGNVDDTYVDIETLNFRIDQDVFKSSATIKNLTKNMLVDMAVDGTLNLANLSQAYPIELEKELKGILRGNVKASFDMDAIETNAYQRINSSGQMNVRDVVFSSDALAAPLQISGADLTFNPSNVTLNNFNAKTGTSDISANGNIENLLGFLFSNSKLKGTFNLNSNRFVVSDFLMESTTSDSSTAPSSNKKAAEPTKIPDFLDCTINAKANTVVYDNLNLKDLRGSLILRDEKATLQDVTSSLFNGIIALRGTISTKTDTPVFDLSIGADGFDIAQSFQDLQLLQTLAPVAKVMQGKLNSMINLRGTLNESFTPNISSVSGDAFAKLLTTNLNSKDGVLGQLGQSLNFIDFSKLKLDELQANLVFEDSKVKVKPFDLDYKDIKITIAGAHGFDMSLDYTATFDVPAKYLGGEVNRLIGKINDNEVNNISIPVTAAIGGTYKNPKITTDLSSGVSNLTKQLIEIEKQKLLNKGTDKIKELLGGINTGGITNPAGKPKDSTSTKTDTVVTQPTDPVKEGVKNILGGLIKKRKTIQDTVKVKQSGTEVKRDSVNQK